MVTDLRSDRSKILICKSKLGMWSLQFFITLRLSELRGYHNWVRYCSNWLREKPNDANLTRAVLVLTTAELALESETTKRSTKTAWRVKIFQGDTDYHSTSSIEDIFRRFWSVKTLAWRDARWANNPGGMCTAEYGIRNKNIWEECAHFDQKLRDKFDIYERDAASGMREAGCGMNWQQIIHSK